MPVIHYLAHDPDAKASRLCRSCLEGACTLHHRGAGACREGNPSWNLRMVAGTPFSRIGRRAEDAPHESNNSIKSRPNGDEENRRPQASLTCALTSRARAKEPQ